MVHHLTKSSRSAAGAPSRTFAARFAEVRSARRSGRSVRFGKWSRWPVADIGRPADVPRGARPPGGRCNTCVAHFVPAKYIRVIISLIRCKSARPRGRSGAARRRVPRLCSAHWRHASTSATGHALPIPRRPDPAQRARPRHLTVSLTDAGQGSDAQHPWGILCQMAITSCALPRLLPPTRDCKPSAHRHETAHRPVRARRPGHRCAAPG